ncbi:MAG: type II 3-dehydroquinate dehydratase [Pseudomonadota bacterium]
MPHATDALNALGTRERRIYGDQTLDDIEQACLETAENLGYKIDFRQSHDEGELVSWIHERKDHMAGLVINAAAYSHTSIAILDALLLVKKPVIEVHLSNIYARERFRHHSHISKAADGVICGLGLTGYVLALQALDELLKARAHMSL